MLNESSFKGVAMSPKSEKQYAEIRELTKSKIETSSISLFSRRGLSVTIAEIAKDAGISQGLLYRYYPSKDALIEALVERAVSSSCNAIGSVWEEELSGKEKIEKISAMMTWMLQMPDNVGTQLFTFMIQVGMNLPQQARMTELLTESKKPMYYLSKIIEQGQSEGSVKEGEPFSLSMIYWAAIQGLCCYSLTGIAIPNKPELISGFLLK